MTANTSDPRRFAPLKPNWFHILVSLAQGDKHGYGIMVEVRERTGDQVKLWPATLYGSMRELEQRGLIEEGEGGEDSDDPRRRYFCLTGEGRLALEREAQRLQALVDMVPHRATEASQR